MDIRRASGEIFLDGNLWEADWQRAEPLPMLKYHTHEPSDEELPRITRIVVRGLTEATHGNASGIGTADYCHKRVVDEMDVEATNINCITGNAPAGAQIPINYDTDRELVATALSTVGLVEAGQEKVLRIHDTLDVGELLVSEAYLSAVEERDDLEILEPATDMTFDAKGDLLEF